MNEKAHQINPLPIGHYEWLDVAKGIGILLVVMGHTIFPVHEAISLFHMPLFFFLSGITLKEVTEPGVFVIKKIDRIAVPYLFYSVISFLIARSIGYDGNVFNGPLWFLQSLFVGIIMSFFILRSVADNKARYAIILLFAIYSQIVTASDYTAFPHDRSFDRVIRSLVFIMLGYQMKHIVNAITNTPSVVRNWISVLASVAVYACLCYVCIFKLKAHGGFLEGTICQFNMPLFYVASLSGILLVISLSVLMRRSKLFKWLGVNSLTIMCLHYPFLQWWNPTVATHTEGLLEKGLMAVGTYVLTIALCVPFVYLFKRYIPYLTGCK